MTVSFERRFLLELPFGSCAGVSLPAGEFELPAALHPEEAAFALTLPEARRAGWVGGRVALRAALEHARVEAQGAYETVALGGALSWRVVWLARRLPPKLPIAVGSEALLAHVRALVAADAVAAGG